jgi:hypothetical protein
MLMPGVGSEIYRGLAAVIVGGMTISAIFTLVLFPSLLRFNEKSSTASNNTNNQQNNVAELNVEPAPLASNH